MDDNKHEHEDCGCGCGHDHDHNHDFEPMIFQLETDGGETSNFQEVGIMEFEGKEYIALVEVEELAKGDDSVELVFMEYVEKEDSVILENIETDEEYEKIANAFLAALENEMDFPDFDEEDED